MPKKGRPSYFNGLPAVLLRKSKGAVLDDDWESTLLPEQLPRAEREPQTPDEKIAFRLLALCISDCTGVSFGPVAQRAHPKKRLRAITEMYQWMANDARAARRFPGRKGFEYSFDWWCENLGVDEGYMRRKLREWLPKWTKEAHFESYKSGLHGN